MTTPSTCNFLSSSNLIRTKPIDSIATKPPESESLFENFLSTCLTKILQNGLENTKLPPGLEDWLAIKLFKILPDTFIKILLQHLLASIENEEISEDANFSSRPNGEVEFINLILANTDKIISNSSSNNSTSNLKYFQTSSENANAKLNINSSLFNHLTKPQTKLTSLGEESIHTLSSKKRSRSKSSASSKLSKSSSAGNLTVKLEADDYEKCLENGLMVEHDVGTTPTQSQDGNDTNFLTLNSSDDEQNDMGDSNLWGNIFSEFQKLGEVKEIQEPLEPKLLDSLSQNSVEVAGQSSDSTSYQPGVDFTPLENLTLSRLPNWASFNNFDPQIILENPKLDPSASFEPVNKRKKEENINQPSNIKKPRNRIRNLNPARKSEFLYKCPICGDSSFTLERAFNRHIVDVHRIRPYSCGICNCQFNRSDALVMHCKKHHTEEFRTSSEWIFCKFCNYRLRKRWYGKHLKMHHPIELSSMSEDDRPKCLINFEMQLPEESKEYSGS